MTEKEKTNLENKVKKFKLSKKITLSLIIGAASLFGTASKVDACGSFRNHSYGSYYSRRYYPRNYYRSYYNYYNYYPYRYFNGCW